MVWRGVGIVKATMVDRSFGSAAVARLQFTAAAIVKKKHWKQHNARCAQIARSDPSVATSSASSDTACVPSPEEPVERPPNSDICDDSGAALLKVGCRAVIHGLRGSIELNGMFGTLQRWDADARRWAVCLDGTSLGLTKLVKTSNLRLFSSPDRGQDQDSLGSSKDVRPSFTFDTISTSFAGALGAGVLLNSRKGLSVAPQPSATNTYGDDEFIVKLQPPIGGDVSCGWMCYDKKRSFTCIVPSTTKGLLTARRLLEEAGNFSRNPSTGQQGMKGYFRAKWEGKNIRVFVDALAPSQKW